MTDTVTIQNRNLQFDLKFMGNDHEQVARLWVEDGQMHFEGNADEAAKDFFDHVIMHYWRR